MVMRGQVDGMEGRYVVGWAASEPDTGNCAITITDAAGSLIANGRASRHRPDLASLGLGRTTLAFRIPLPEMPASQWLHVSANGEALPGSPIFIGGGRFDGHCVVEGATVTGWVTERVAAATRPAITVVNQHGVQVGRGISTTDLANFDALFVPARFSVALDAQCFGGGEMELSVQADGVTFAHGACHLRLQGNLEILNPQSCSGWLISPDAPGYCFEIELFRDGIKIATASCEHRREDVRALFADCTTPGFGIRLAPSAHSATAAEVISLRLKGAAAELFNGPYVLASQAAAVTAAHRAARLANMALPGIGAGERAVLQLALAEFLAKARKSEGFTATRQADAQPRRAATRFAVIIPVYRGVDVTRACIDSVLAHRAPETDRLVLINDHAPDPQMAPLLGYYATLPNVFLLTNPKNLGFVKTVNRGLGFTAGLDVLLLNADTLVFAGGFDELHRTAYTAPEIGTVTALSNNATIFSYPHINLRQELLADISWPELAQAALQENAGQHLDVPTGHGFCMYIKAEVVRRTGLFDEGFGRGYGEENDFCARSAALGYRHVAAGGVLVEHKESISFANEKAGLMAQNLPRLNELYPEYTPIIMAFERAEGLRAARWGLDRLRLARAAAAGQNFVLVVTNALEGGTAKAIRDLEQHIGYGAATALNLRRLPDGMLELGCEAPLMLAHFADGEIAALLSLLDAAAPGHVLVHQLLGFPAAFITALHAWSNNRHRVFYAHDFYTLCPRVTMIDAVGRFCDVADTDTCARCIDMGGAHASSVLTALSPAAHRALFAEFLGGATHVVAPSANTAQYLHAGFPALNIDVIAHPEALDGVPAQPRAGDDREITLLGAIGPHKGSAKLLEIAQRARLTHPHLSFRVIGYTDIDQALRAVGNVTVTGSYMPDELAQLLAEARGRLALFLSTWPETYSYTLSEAVRAGFVPLVPDIGAPAERVRAAGLGAVFPFPAEAASLLRFIDEIAAGRVQIRAEGATPAKFFPMPELLRRTSAILNMPGPAPAPAAFG